MALDRSHDSLHWRCLARIRLAAGGGSAALDMNKATSSSLVIARRATASPLRADGAAEGVAKRVAGILRPGQCGRGDLRIRRRVSACVGVFHGSCPRIDCYLCGVAAYRSIISSDSSAGAICSQAGSPNRFFPSDGDHGEGRLCAVPMGNHRQAN